MKVIRLCFLILLISAHRLPAPILEVQEKSTSSPIPQKLRPKLKSTERQSDPAASKSARQFDGTWTGSGSYTDANNSTWAFKNILLISGGRSAVVASELTLSRPPGGTWNDLPAAISTAALFARISYRSVDFKVDGSNLTVRWGPSQFSDWAPKEIPANIREQFAANFNQALSVRNVAVYTLREDTLTRENDPSGSKVSYRRVR